MDENLTCPTCFVEPDSLFPILLSIVIPAYNASDDLRACLSSLQGTIPVPYEILVVDDASTDTTPQVAQEFAVSLFSRTIRSGPASARNLGCREAQGQWVFFIDADVTVEPDTIANALTHIHQNPSIDAIFGSYDNAPADPGLVSQFRNLLHHHVHQTGDFHDNIRQAQTFWTGCGFIRRDVFLKLGGFDHWRYNKPAIEDIEFGYRLIDAGHHTVLARNVLCKHRKRWTIPSMLRTDFFQRGLPWSLLMLRSTRQTNDLNVDKIQKLAALAAAQTWLGLLLAALVPFSGMAIALASCTLMISLNLNFFRLLRSRGGLILAFASIGLMNLYYLVCLSSYATAVLVWILQDKLGLLKTKSTLRPFPYSNHIAEALKNRNSDTIRKKSSTLK